MVPAYFAVTVTMTNKSSAMKARLRMQARGMGAVTPPVKAGAKIASRVAPVKTAAAAGNGTAATAVKEELRVEEAQARISESTSTCSWLHEIKIIRRRSS